jgi:hypothetical protein
MGEESAGFGGGGEDADDVEIDAAEEDLVGGQGRGRDVHRLELGVDQVVDAIIGFVFGG